MKTIGNILYLEYAEYVPMIVSEINYKNQQFRKTIKVLGRGGNGNTVLIQWESIPVKYQLKFKKYNCLGSCDHCKKDEDTGLETNPNNCDWNPYQEATETPLKSRLVLDFKAQQYYLNFRFDNGSALTEKQIQTFTTAINWLNLLQDISTKKDFIKKELNLSITEFWVTVSKILERDHVSLPTSYKRLRMKLDEYKEHGYYIKIKDSNFGNQNSAKIKDELCESVLSGMIEHPHQFDDVYITQQYNIWAKENGYKTIDVATVGIHRRKNEWKLKYFREGENEYNKSHNLTITRKRPTHPLFLINSDDNNLDIYFIDVDATGGGKYFKKLVLIVLIDCYNDYVLGYSWRIAESPVVEMVQTAYLDAAYQVKKMTGDFHMWHEIKTDRWALATLKPFYENQAFFNPQSFKNAKSKHIEQSFGEQWHDILKRFNGYSGHNISSKNRGVNPDWIVENKKNFYTLDEAGMVVEAIVKGLRNLPGKMDKTVTREQEWLNGWNAMPEQHKRKVDDEFILSRFGKEHVVRNRKYPNEIKNNGVVVQIDKTSYQYIIPKELHQQLIGIQVKIIYDLLDMSRVLLVNEDRNIRIVAQTFERTPSAAKDFGKGDRTLLNEYMDIKRYNVRQITDAQIKRRELLKENGINIEGMLQAGMGNMVKETSKYAELAYEMKQLGMSAKQNETIDESEDFDPYELMK